MASGRKRAGREVREERKDREWGRPRLEADLTNPPVEKEAPSLEPSGLLYEDEPKRSSKYQEPGDRATPADEWRIYVFKGDELLDTLYIHRQSSYLIGKNPEVLVMCMVFINAL